MLRLTQLQETLEQGLYFQICTNNYIFSFNLHSSLCVSQSCAASRTHAAPEAEDINTGTGTEGPQIKRCKKDETDLSFLLVKNKDGQDGLFVDLGKRSHNLFLLFTLHSVTKCNSYH